MKASSKKFCLDAAVALLVPLLFLAVFLISRGPPTASLLEGDPDFGYLFNSLMITDGLTPAHIDHPGTPVQLLGAFVMIVSHGGRANLDGDFFSSPAYFHRAILFALFGIFLLGQWYCGFALLRSGVSRISSLLVQLLPFLFRVTIPYLGHVSPELPLLGFGLALIPSLREWTKGRKDAGPAVAIGILLGLLVSLKFVALPLLGLLLLAPSRRALVLSSGLSALSFAGFTAPIWNRYTDMLGWLGMLATHSGLYGTGPVGAPTPVELGGNLARLAQEQGVWPLIPALLVSLAALVAPFRAREPVFRRGVPSACAGVLLVLVLKHPAARYLLPLVPLLGLVLLRLERIPAGWRSLLAAGVLLPALSSLPRLALAQRDWRAMEAEVAEVAQRELDRRYARCAITVLSPAPLAPFALYSGNLAGSQEHYGAKLTALFPHYTFYFAEPTSFEGHLEEAAWYSRLAKYPCRVAVGRPEQAELAIRTLFRREPARELLLGKGAGTQLGIYRLP